MPLRVIVLGATGMLGSAACRVLSMLPEFETFGVARRGAEALPYLLPARAIALPDVLDMDAVDAIIKRTSADIVINAVGVVKQVETADDPLAVIPINALLPHQLAWLCAKRNARLIHVSTDCVFDGSRGGYTEDDTATATDLYGRSKLLGEVEYPNAITLRTSIVGHELTTRHGLIDWFLGQEGQVFGFSKAVFSGLTTVELTKVIAHYVIPRPELRGLYHIAAEPINKLDLLKLVAEIYEKRIKIVPRDKPEIDRSLRSDRFNAATGYKPPDWGTMIGDLRAYYSTWSRPQQD